MACSLGAVALASGAGSRFGGGCKLLAPFRGKPLIAHVLIALPPALFARRLAVTRSPEIQALAESLGFPALLHPWPDLSDTIRLGTEAMEDLDGCLYAVGDQPLLSPRTVERLAEAFRAQPNAIVRASCGGVPGNPVIFPRTCYPALRTLPPGKGGSHVIAAGLWPVALVEAESPLEMRDVDTREDYENLTR